jgi:hypothetical protein
VSVVADGIERRFIGTVRFVRDNHALRVCKNFLHSGEIDAVLGEVDRLFVRFELQPHEHNVCLLASSVNFSPDAKISLEDAAWPSSATSDGRIGDGDRHTGGQAVAATFRQFLPPEILISRSQKRASEKFLENLLM